MFDNSETSVSIGTNIEDIIDDSAHEANLAIMRGVQDAILVETESQYDLGKKISPNWQSAMSAGGMHIYIPFGEENQPLVVPPTPESIINPLYYYQEEALEILKLLVQDEFLDEETAAHYRELIINLPTGSGKTRIFLELLAWWKKFNVTVIAAPSITLLRQIENDTKIFMQEHNKDFNYGVVCSDTDITEEQRNDEDDPEIILRMKNHGHATTNVNEISNIISNSKKPLIIFSTYDSLTKIGIASLELGITLDLLIGDEAHRMSNEKASPNLFQENLPVKYKAFFTATVRSKKSNRDVDLDFPMNNKDLFGPIAYVKTPRELINGDGINPGGFILDINWVSTEWNEKYYKIIEHRTDLTTAEKQEFVLFVSGLIYVYKETGRIKNIAFVPSIKNSARWYKDNFGLLQKIINGAVGEDINLTPFVISQEVIGPARTKLLKNYSECQNSILFNYQVIKEGIDVQSCNSITWLRKMDGVGIVQSLGRAMRKDSKDKTKMLGYVICPMTVEGNQSRGAYVRQMLRVTGGLIEYGYADLIIGDPLRENPHTSGILPPRPPMEIGDMTMAAYHKWLKALKVESGEFVVDKRYRLSEEEAVEVDDIFDV